MLLNHTIPYYLNSERTEIKLNFWANFNTFSKRYAEKLYFFQFCFIIEIEDTQKITSSANLDWCNTYASACACVCALTVTQIVCNLIA